MAPKQQHLDLHFFKPISKEERESNAQKAFALLEERLEKEGAIPKEIFRRLVGRPRKEIQVVLLKPKVEPMKPMKKKQKVCSRVCYTN